MYLVYSLPTACYRRSNGVHKNHSFYRYLSAEVMASNNLVSCNEAFWALIVMWPLIVFSADSPKRMSIDAVRRAEVIGANKKSNTPNGRQRFSM